MRVKLICATTTDGFIARHSTEITTWTKDLLLFKQQTMNKTVIMGSNTFNTLEGELNGRRLNDAMSVHVVNKLIREMSNKRIPIGGAKVLVMGVTFKENCPDIRNSKVIDVVNELKGFGCDVSIFDPLASDSQLKVEYNMTLVDELLDAHFDSVIIAVGHDYFKNLGLRNIRKLAKETNVIFDMKYLFGNSEHVLKL